MLTKTPRPTIGSAKYCAVTLRAEDPDGFYNTQHTLTGFDPMVWISSFGARELAKAEGWTSPADVENLHDQIATLEAEYERAVQEISKLRRQVESIEVLKQVGMEATKKVGAPSKRTRPEEIKKELENA